MKRTVSDCLRAQRRSCRPIFANCCLCSAHYFSVFFNPRKRNHRWNTPFTRTSSTTSQNWPDSEKRGDFVIGVVGNTPLFDELKAAIATKTAGSQHIIVKKLTASMPSYDCQILFLSEGESWSLEKIAQRTEGAPVLLISEDKDAASRGACINFSIVSERLKLEINKNNIENRRLRIANELLRLGKIVK